MGTGMVKCALVNVLVLIAWRIALPFWLVYAAIAGVHWLLNNIFPIATWLVVKGLHFLEQGIDACFGVFVNALESDELAMVVEIIDKLFSIQEVAAKFDMGQGDLELRLTAVLFFQPVSFKVQVNLHTIVQDLLLGTIDKLLGKIIPNYPEIKKGIQSRIDEVKKFLKTAKAIAEDSIGSVKDFLDKIASFL